MNLKGNYIGDMVTTSIFIKCDKYKIQLSVFYKRGNFFWVGAHDNKIQNV